MKTCTGCLTAFEDEERFCDRCHVLLPDPELASVRFDRPTTDLDARPAGDLDGVPADDCIQHPGFPVGGSCQRCGEPVCVRCAPSLTGSGPVRCMRCRPREEGVRPAGGSHAELDRAAPGSGAVQLLVLPILLNLVVLGFGTVVAGGVALAEITRGTFFPAALASGFALAFVAGTALYGWALGLFLARKRSFVTLMTILSALRLAQCGVEGDWVWLVLNLAVLCWLIASDEVERTFIRE